MDVRRDNYLRIINAFNKIEAAKAYLFSNSEFSAEVWDTKIARDIFWEESLHGYYKENVGIYPKDYQSEEEFFNISIERLFLRQQERANHIILNQFESRTI